MTYLAWTGLALAVVLSIIDFLTEGIFFNRGKIKEVVVSLAGGVSAAYIFLALLPLLYSGVAVLSKFLFVFVLLGFAAYYLIEKMIYQHTPREQIVHKIKVEHSVTLFFYHVIIGLELVALTKFDLFAGLLFFFPVMLHLIVDALPHQATKNVVRKLLLTSGSVFGALFALLVEIPQTVHFALLGLMTGLLLFLEIREVIPQRRRGRAEFFVLGMVGYGALIIITWFVL